MINNKFKFNIIGLFTTDNKSMVPFYRDVIGFTTDWNGEEPDVRMRMGDMWLIMFPRKNFERMTNREYTYPQGLNSTMELALNVPTFKDVDDEYSRVTALGGKAHIRSANHAMGTTYLLCSCPGR